MGVYRTDEVLSGLIRPTATVEAMPLHEDGNHASDLSMSVFI